MSSCPAGKEKQQRNMPKFRQCRSKPYLNQVAPNERSTYTSETPNTAYDREGVRSMPPD
jgi:hypothetical protein